MYHPIMGKKYVSLKDEDRSLLELLKSRGSSERVRDRAHALLLSDKGYDINSLSDVFSVGRDTISSWISRWVTEGRKGLLDKDKPGRPRCFTEVEEKKMIVSAESTPIQRINVFTQKQNNIFDKKSSSRTIKRILKKAGLLWKRMRKSLKDKRDESLFRFFKEEVEILKQQAVREEIDLFYFDGSGFNLNPNVPYCWTKKGKTVKLPALRSKGYTVLGLLNIHKNKFQGNLYEGAANSECVIQTLDELANGIEKTTVVILDNASIHKSKIVQEKMKAWREKGMLLQFIPAYSPELNLIEILWKMMKHFWLEPKHYFSMDVLKEAIIKILQEYGKAYSISFG